MIQSKIINEQTWFHYLCQFESGQLNENLIGPLFQFMVNSGYVWNLQGFHISKAKDLIEDGVLVWGEKPFKNAYGLFSVPSRYEVGNKPGSLEYQKKQGYKYINV